MRRIRIRAFATLRALGGELGFLGEMRLVEAW
jgi:hypothetical protein